MKFACITRKRSPGNLVGGRRAFTLPEMMVTAGVFSLVVVGVVYAQLFGLKLDQLTNSKLGASDQTRQSYNLLMTDIRSAKLWTVGNGTVLTNDTLTNYTMIANGSNQIGSALMLNESATATNIYILYYFDTNHSTDGKLTGQLRRSHITNGIAPTSQVIVDYLQGTNMVFRVNDFQGKIRTDQQYKGYVSILLEFYQYQYPITKIGNGFYYDYYRTTFTLSPHVPDGP